MLFKETVELLEQLPFVIVHLNTEGLVVTVTELVGEAGVAIVAAPLTTDQAPVSPVAGALAAIVKILLLHFVWPGPAFDKVEEVFVSVTDAKEVQLPFAIVHLNVAGLVVTVTVLLGELIALIEAAPLVTVQVPVSPAPGKLAAIV
jgi:hypothetical protein